MYQKHSKHVFTGIIIVVLCGIGLFLWGSVRYEQKAMLGNGMSTMAGSSIQTSYVHPDASFSLAVPKDLTFSDPKQDPDSETIVFSGNTSARTFQIHISKWDSFDDLDVASISAGAPGIIIDESQSVAVDGARGVAFISGPRDGARTRQIWFVHDDKLYRVSTFKLFDEPMADILSTWKWR